MKTSLFVLCSSLATAQAFFATADPDVLLRGQTARITVRGRDDESLRTLAVKPPNGVRIVSVTPLPNQPRGQAAATVTIAVDPSAQPGKRALMLTIAPNRQDGFSGSEAVRQPGNKQTNTALNDAFEHVTKNATRPEEYGEIYINSHTPTVTAVEIRRGDPGQARITVNDPAGNFQPAPPRPGAGGITVLSAAEWLSSELHCGQDILEDALSPIEGNIVVSKAGPTTIVATELPQMEFKTNVCELKVRVRDRLGNTSPWLKTRVSLR